jgi:hypothetical protein
MIQYYTKGTIFTACHKWSSLKCEAFEIHENAYQIYTKTVA